MRWMSVAALSTVLAASACVTVVAPGTDPDHDPANPRAPTVAFTPIPDPLMAGAMPLAEPLPASGGEMSAHAMHGSHDAPAGDAHAGLGSPSAESHTEHQAPAPAGAHGGHEMSNDGAHAGHEMPAAGAHAALSQSAVAAEDSLVREYLAAAAALAKDEAATAASHVVEVKSAALDLAGASSGDVAAAATHIAEAAPEETKDIEALRKGFKGFSEAVIALVKASPPTDAVAPQLRKAYCPMADAAWLQTDTTIANPYFGSKMLHCGRVNETIETTPAKKGE